MLGGLQPDQVINLGFFDGTLEQMANDENKIIPGIFTKKTDINIYREQNISTMASGLSGVSNWNSLVNNLVYLLEKINPDIIVTPYPLIDYNNDHKYASYALIQAMHNAGMHDGKLFFYTNSYDVNKYYPLGKIGSVISLPPNFNRELYFTKIYSHPLTCEMQSSKILALDAMNDLRPDTEWRFFDVAIKRAIRIKGKKILHRDESYFRRAVRSNELFFVIEVKDIYDELKLGLIQGERK